MPPDPPPRAPADPADALLARVDVLADLGRWADALPLLHEALALDPAHPRALGQLARARLGTGDPRGALEAADGLVAVRPGGDWGHRLRSITLRRLGRHADALAAAQEAVRLAPNGVDSHDVLFHAHLARNDHAAARAAAERWLALAPDAARPHAGLATVALRTRRWADAEAHARAALAIDPSHVDALGALATAQLRLGRGREAVETAFGAARLAPGGEARTRFLDTYREYLQTGSGRARLLLSTSVALVVIIIGTALGDDHATAKPVLLASLFAFVLASELWRASRLPPDVRAALRAERRLPVQRYARWMAGALRRIVLIAALAFTIPALFGGPARPDTAAWWAAYALLVAAAGAVLARWWRRRMRR